MTQWMTVGCNRIPISLSGLCLHQATFLRMLWIMTNMPQDASKKQGLSSLLAVTLQVCWCLLRLDCERHEPLWKICLKTRWFQRPPNSIHSTFQAIVLCTTSTISCVLWFALSQPFMELWTLFCWFRIKIPPVVFGPMPSNFVVLWGLLCSKASPVFWLQVSWCLLSLDCERHAPLNLCGKYMKICLNSSRVKSCTL